MATNKKYKNAIYNQAIFSDPAINLQTTLQSLLAGALSKVDDRREVYAGEENEGLFRVLNQHDGVGNALFGQFLVYEPGKSQPLVKLEADKEYYELDAKKPSKNEAFSEDIFYFGIRDNHLVCIQTRAISIRTFEKYLFWLLATKTNAIANDVTMHIISQPPEEVYERVQNNPVRSIKIGTSVLSSAVEEEGGKATTKRFAFSGLTGKVMKAVLDQERFKNLRFEEGFDEANLHLYIEFRFKHKTTEEGQKAVDSVASAFRGIDAEDYELLLKDGGTIKGQEMKISKRVCMTLTPINGLVIEHDLYKEMHDFLIDTLKSLG